MLYDMVLAADEETVVSSYEKVSRKIASYQNEKDLEAEFIKNLLPLGYKHISISKEEDLKANLRVQLEKLNKYQFEDTEWDKFFIEQIVPANEGIIEKTKKIQQNHIIEHITPCGETKDIYLIDKYNIHNNSLQLINQYEAEGVYKLKYDVTILVNGLPLVHIELKKRGAALKTAFNQINRYERDSFWSSCGLYEYIQIFVISNGMQTKYYANTVRKNHIETKTSKRYKRNKTSNSFEFTSFWTTVDNKKILDLRDFTKTFFARHTILSIITKYSIFTANNLLQVMRPYQIASCERILNRINTAYNSKKYGTMESCGYIWHASGSGKTLTSFRTSQIAVNFPFIDKVIFVVDKKDLDYQSVTEYEKYGENSVNSNKCIKVLQEQIEKDDNKIIITTIQKLAHFVQLNSEHNIYNKQVVIIFDECCGFQFDNMYKDITNSFKNHYIFGFTGTPVLASSILSGINGKSKTTEQIFGANLHTYQILEAIGDQTILPFRIDYINPVEDKDNKQDELVKDADPEKEYLSNERIANIVSYILVNFDRKTKRSKTGDLTDKRNKGFNSIFAVSSVSAAMKYYNEFKIQQLQDEMPLRIGVIYGFSSNNNSGYFIDEESLDIENLEQNEKDFLENAIGEYNSTFGTNFTIEEESLELYYKDISKRVKDREIDLLIVVNMFLTGFDSATLNTLWVDKNLCYHGLIQAFSRTNRVLNSVKTFGSIVCFRDLSKAVTDAFNLFFSSNIEHAALLKNYESYLKGYTEDGVHYKGYIDYIEEFKKSFPIGTEITLEEQEKRFIRLFGKILQLRNILNTFEKFYKDDVLTQSMLQDYQSTYIDLYDKYIGYNKLNNEDVNSEDINFEFELIKQVEVNIDYILKLAARYLLIDKGSHDLRMKIQKTIMSNIELRSKKELIDAFIIKTQASSEEEILTDWHRLIEQEKEKELARIVKDEKLNELETKRFMAKAFDIGELETNSSEIDDILPSLSLFNPIRQVVRERVCLSLLEYFNKYYGIS